MTGQHGLRLTEFGQREKDRKYAVFSTKTVSVDRLTEFRAAHEKKSGQHVYAISFGPKKTGSTREMALTEFGQL